MTDVTAYAELVGQRSAIEAVIAAAQDAHGVAGHGGAMTHAWLITGPPGSGRSNLAYAFATALLSDPSSAAEQAAGRPDPRVQQQVDARSHPDLAVLASDRVTITIDEVRRLVAGSAYSPSVARYRVLVVEDADRMTERTSNVLLKALEEPPERTVWILCAPSEADLLPTIRSRVRVLRLRVPEPSEVADLLVARDGVDRAVALRAAEEAQSHIGMAHRLATDPEARARREETIRLTLETSSVSQAVRAAQRLLDIAKEDALALTEERDDAERGRALTSMGVEEGGTVPPQLRSVIRQLEDDQKKRATRGLRDAVDRVLLDLLSVHRDVLLSQLGGGLAPVNAAWRDATDALGARTTPGATLEVLDAIADARRRLPANVPPLLALEAVLVTAALARSGR
jgi:DNA polymerase-3 subunit delta'